MAFYQDQGATVDDDTPIKLMRLWTDHMVIPHVYSILDGDKTRVPEWSVVQTKMCTAATHLGLRPEMTREQFEAKLCWARNKVFERTMQEGVRLRKCVWCGTQFKRAASLGRHQCMRHIGTRLDTGIYMCCNSRLPCTPADHMDESDVAADEHRIHSHTLLHVVLLLLWKVPSSSICPVASPTHIDTGRAMVSTEVASVASPGSLLCVRVMPQ